MANYLNTTILCESYIYVSSYDLTPKMQGTIETTLKGYASSRAPFFFDTSIDIDVDVIEGSLKTKVTVCGSIAAVIMSYGSLRSGIEMMYKDARFVASSLVTESLFAAQVRRPEVDRVEVRTGLPGSIKRIIQKIDNLSKQTTTISPDQMGKELAAISKSLDNLLEKIEDDADKKAVKDGLQEIMTEALDLPLEKPKDVPKHEAHLPIYLHRDRIEEILKKLRNSRN